MTLFRNSLSCVDLRKTAITAIAGVSLSCMGGDLAVSPTVEGLGLAYSAFPMAMALDWGENHHGWRGHRADGDRDEDGDGKKQHREDQGDGKKRGDDHGRNFSRLHNDKGGSNFHHGDQPPWREHALHFDAQKKMVGMSFKVGRDRRDVDHHGHHFARLHDGPHWELLHRGDHEGNPISAAFVHNIHHDASHDVHTERALERAVTPVARRYAEGRKAPHVGETVFAKNGFALGASEHAPREVLAVGLDPQSVERARALGFQADAPAGTDEVTRLTAPPSLDAFRARELLNHEFPGQQFELNKLYRVYRAQMRDEPGPSVRIAPRDEKCPEDRCFARATIGWKDELGFCAATVKVGVIDTGFDLAHPVFAGRNNIHPFDFLTDGRKPAPDWHGTGVLSVLAANPSSDAPGLIPDAEFFAASVFFIDDDGEMAADTVSVLKALDWMKKNDVKIVNMSFAGPRDELVALEIERMAEAGVIFVAAAGNEGPVGPPSYPAAYEQVVAVTAVTKDLRNYRYANRGPQVDVAAPGVDIWAAVPGGREGYHTGTSFAAPYVTAVLAVEPRDAPAQDKAALLDSLSVRDLGDEGRDEIYGRGLLLAPTSCKPPSNVVASAE
jgi:subtilisin family serine protease